MLPAGAEVAKRQVPAVPSPAGDCALLAQGSVPWNNPWKARTGLPRSFVTHRPYRGVNVFLLLAMNYESLFWLSFRQALQLGGNVRVGEKSCQVVFWKRTTIEDEKSGQTKEIRVLRIYHVFNVMQCDGLKIESARTELPAKGILKPAEIVARIPQALSASGGCHMTNPQVPKPAPPNPDSKVRRLKIEETGDP